MDKRQDNRSREMSDDDLLQVVAAAAAENPEVEAGEVLECEPACNFDPSSGVIGAQF
jgi:hypothetical protein